VTRLAVLAVGKLRNGAEREIAERYAKRIVALAKSLGFSGFEAKEASLSRQPTVEARRAAEAEAVLASIDRGRLVALDERGQSLSSDEFAGDIKSARDAGLAVYAIAIGGPDGHGERLRARADLMLSFGRMTWPHELVRAMAMEQLYRALTILGGHPYHRA